MALFLLGTSLFGAAYLIAAHFLPSTGPGCESWACRPSTLVYCCYSNAQILFIGIGLAVFSLLAISAAGMLARNLIGGARGSAREPAKESAAEPRGQRLTEKAWLPVVVFLVGTILLEAALVKATVFMRYPRSYCSLCHGLPPLPRFTDAQARMIAVGVVVFSALTLLSLGGLLRQWRRERRVPRG